MTLQEAIDYVLGNLSDRREGFIGSQSPADAAMFEINLAVKELSKHEDAPEWESIHNVNLLSGESSFALPLINGQRTRAVSGMFYQEGDDFYPMTFFPQEAFFERTLSETNTETNRPFLYTYYGNTIHVFPKASEDITIRLYLSLYPPKFTGADLPNELSLDPDWDTTIIAYATYKLFLRLQQETDVIFWKREYNECKKTATHSLRKRRMEPDYRDLRNANIDHNRNPANDPFIKSWR